MNVVINFKKGNDRWGLRENAGTDIDGKQSQEDKCLKKRTEE